MHTRPSQKQAREQKKRQTDNKYVSMNMHKLSVTHVTHELAHLLHERVVVGGRAKLDRDAVHLQQLVALGRVVRSVREAARAVEGVDRRLHLHVVGDLQVHLVLVLVL